MTTTAQLIEYLKSIPEDTEVEVLEEYSSSYHTSTRFVPLDLGENSNVVFFFEALGRKFLHLGDQ